MQFFKEKPKCPYGHCLQSVDDDGEVCDMCNGMCNGMCYVCPACSFWTICAGCYEGLRSIWDIMKCYYEYDTRYLLRCPKDHVLRLKHPVDGKCRECNAPYAYTCCDYPRDRHLDYSCMYFLCKRCYRDKTWDHLRKIKQNDFTSCPYCKGHRNPGRRLIIETDSYAMCSSCSESLEGRSTFQCNDHPASRICRKCRMKEKLGYNDEEETVADDSSEEEIDTTCQICYENQIKYSCAECGHTYCGKCINDIKASQNPVCSFCRTSAMRIRKLRFK